MMLLFALTAACIVQQPKSNETGGRPTSNGDGTPIPNPETGSDTGGELDDPWGANAISFDFEGAVVQGEIVDGASLGGTTYPATFGITLMSTTGARRSCNVHYRVAGAPSSTISDLSEHWRAWDFSGYAIEDTFGSCDSLETIFQGSYPDLEILLQQFNFNMGVKSIADIRNSTENDWDDSWSGDWDEDYGMMAAGSLYVAPFAMSYEMNILLASAMDPHSLEIQEDEGGRVIPVPLASAEIMPDGFYQSTAMYVIGTSW